MIRVLIADDHAILRAGLKHLLSEQSDIIVAGEAANGHEALDKAQAEHWDAMVLDMTMPGRSGIDLIKQLKQCVPKLPLLILSMHKEDVYAVRALKAGASGYLCKDNAEEQLVTALRKVAGGGLYINAAVAEKLAADMLHGDGRDIPPHTRLSDREYQIFQLLAAGTSVTDIAQHLNLSVKTVSTHKTHVLEKMACASVADLVRYAVSHGLLPASPE
jgi:DNA-binding NarL/FixJ family response regulator